MLMMIEDKVAKVEKLIKEHGMPDEICIDEDSSTCDYAEDLEYYLYKKMPNTNISIHFGCTQIAIVIEGCCKVIKMPIKCTRIDKCDDGGETYRNFYCANDIEEYQNDDCDDYCLNSYHKYQIAEKGNWHQLLAKMEWYSRIGTNDIYIQDKVTSLESDEGQDYVDSHSNTISINTSKIYHEHYEYHIADSLWTRLAIEWYGTAILENFIKNAKKYNMLNDLHWGNLGFDYRGAPVILDWAGYREGDE